MGQEEEEGLWQGRGLSRSTVPLRKSCFGRFPTMSMGVWPYEGAARAIADRLR